MPDDVAGAEDFGGGDSLKSITIELPDDVADRVQASPEAHRRLRDYAIRTYGKASRSVVVHKPKRRPKPPQSDDAPPPDPWDALWNAIPSTVSALPPEALTREAIYADHD